MTERRLSSVKARLSRAPWRGCTRCLVCLLCNFYSQKRLLSADRGTYGRKSREAIRLSDTVHSVPHHFPSALYGCLLIGYVGEGDTLSDRMGHRLRHVFVLSHRKLSLRSSGKEQRRDGGRARYRACGLRNLHLSERRALESLSLVRALLLDDQSERGVRREHAFARGKLVCGLRPGGAAEQKSGKA